MKKFLIFAMFLALCAPLFGQNKKFSADSVRVNNFLAVRLPASAFAGAGDGVLGAMGVIILTDTTNASMFAISSLAGRWWLLSNKTGSGTVQPIDLVIGVDAVAHFNADNNFGVGGQSTFGTSATNTIAIPNGTAPTTSPANAVQIYSEDVSGTAELKVRNEAGNVTVLSNPASFIWSKSGEATQSDSIRFVQGSNVTLTRSGNALTIAASAGGATNLDGLSDVDITGAASGNILIRRASGIWVDTTSAAINLSGFQDDGTIIRPITTTDRILVGASSGGTGLLYVRSPSGAGSVGMTMSDNNGTAAFSFDAVNIRLGLGGATAAASPQKAIHINASSSTGSAVRVENQSDADVMDYTNPGIDFNGSANTEDPKLTTSNTGEEWLVDIGNNGTNDIRFRDAGTLIFSDGTNSFQINPAANDIASYNSAAGGHNFNEWITATEQGSDPSTTILTSLNKMAMYMKNDKLVFAYNNGGTITYITIPMDGTSILWSHSTTAP